MYVCEAECVEKHQPVSSSSFYPDRVAITQ